MYQDIFLSWAMNSEADQLISVNELSTLSWLGSTLVSANTSSYRLIVVHCQHLTGLDYLFLNRLVPYLYLPWWHCSIGLKLITKHVLTYCEISAIVVITVSQKTTDLLKNERLRYILIFTIPIFTVLFVIIFSIVSGGGQQFSNLAQAFIHGHLNFLSPIGGVGQDPVLYHGRIYWDDGPFPSVALMPFVALLDLFHHHFYQGYIQWVMVVGILFFVFRLARILLYSIEDSLILASVL